MGKPTTIMGKSTTTIVHILLPVHQIRKRCRRLLLAFRLVQLWQSQGRNRSDGRSFTPRLLLQGLSWVLQYTQWNGWPSWMIGVESIGYLPIHMTLPLLKARTCSKSASFDPVPKCFKSTVEIASLHVSLW